ncbi:MAG TPA: tetratricopeptide repeat protein, partial [Longimicrobiaceae bacterium]
MTSGCAPDRAGELAAALESGAGVAPRLTRLAAFRPCPERVPEGGTVPRADCPAPRHPDRLDRLAAELAEARDDPDARYALAVLDVVVDDRRGKALDRSVSSFRKAAELADRPAAPLADLAGALIVRAERTQAPRDLLEAYETAERALRDDPRNVTALYNRALALDRLGLVDETARGWEAYLEVDPRSGWADEARRRLRGVPSAATPRPGTGEPQGDRELGMNRLLGEWGEAVLAGDARGAEDRLARAGALGAALERRS